MKATAPLVVRARPCMLAALAVLCLGTCTRPPPIERPPAPAPSERPSAAAGRSATRAAAPVPERTDGLTGGRLVFSDTFDRAEFGADWNALHPPAWRLENGAVRGVPVPSEDDRNQGLWLNRPLPAKVRVQFDAKSSSDVGDIKCEIFNLDPRHETGYAVIFGGWRNSINTIARLGEHEPNRVEQRPHVKVVKDRVYKWAIVRNDNVVRWYVDGKHMLSYDDREPVKGAFFGFNNWATDVTFDNLEIYELD